MKLLFFHNDTNGRGKIEKLDWIQRRTNSKWILSDTSDVAIMPYVVMDTIDFKVIPEDFFITSDKLTELQDVFYISYQPGVEGIGRITPIVRSGAVSIIQDDNTFILDAFAFPGNSGSPAFVRPFIVGDSTSISQNCKFVGLVSSYISYQDVAVSLQTKKARIVFEENTGLTNIISVQAIQQLFKTEKFIEQHKIYKENIKKFM